MLCAVHYRWREDGRHWTDTYTFYINVKDGDIKRAAKVIRKRFGKLVGGYNLEDGGRLISKLMMVKSYIGFASNRYT